MKLQFVVLLLSLALLCFFSGSLSWIFSVICSSLFFSLVRVDARGGGGARNHARGATAINKVRQQNGQKSPGRHGTTNDRRRDGAQSPVDRSGKNPYGKKN